MQVAGQVVERGGHAERSHPAVDHVPVTAHVLAAAEAVGTEVGVVGIVGIHRDVAARADAAEREAHRSVAFACADGEEISIHAGGDGALELADDVAAGARNCGGSI